MGAFDDLVPRAPQQQAQGAAPPWWLQALQGANAAVNPIGALTQAVVTPMVERAMGQRPAQHPQARPQQPPQRPAGGAFSDLIPQARPPQRSSVAQAPSLGDQLFGNAGMRQVAEGVPILGQAANYMDAATNATLAPYVEPLLDRIPGHNKADDVNVGPWQARFDQALMDQRAMDAAEHQAHPIISTAQNVAGLGLGTLALGPKMSPASGLLAKAAPAAGLVPKMAAGAIDGGLIGSGMGYLSGQGGFTDPSRVSNAETGGAFGAAGGAAMPVVAKGAGLLWQNTGQKLADILMGPIEVGASGAQPTAGSFSAGGNISPQDYADAVAATAGSPKISAPASAVNAAYDRILRATARAGQSPSEAIAATTNLGPFGMLADSSVPAQDLARAVADAPGSGGKVAADALNLRQSGNLQAGQYVVRPSSQRVGDSLAGFLGASDQQAGDRTAELLAGQKAAAAPAYAQAYAHPPVPADQLADFSSSPMFENAYQRARQISQSEFVPQPGGAAKLQPLPAQIPDQLDWRTLDLMKQGMDDARREGVVQGIGANEQRATDGFRNAFVSTLDGLNPDYATARAAFSGPAQSMDAIEAGQNYMKDDAPTVQATISSLSPGDQQNFRIGALQAFRDKLGSIPDTYNAALRAGVNTPNALAKFQQLFPDQDSFGQFHDMLSGENTMFATRARVLGGSLTSKNLEQAADADTNPLENVGHAINAVRGDPGSIMHLVGALMTAGNGQGLSEPTANAAAGILFNMNNNAYPEFLEGLTAAQRRAALAQTLAGLQPATGGVGGYAAGGLAPQPNPPPVGP